jgi:hypothetical protein
VGISSKTIDKSSWVCEQEISTLPDGKQGLTGIILHRCRNPLRQLVKSVLAMIRDRPRIVAPEFIKLSEVKYSLGYCNLFFLLSVVTRSDPPLISGPLHQDHAITIDLCESRERPMSTQSR